jgi:hypothetical protein
LRRLALSPLLVILLVKTLGPLDHLGGESFVLPIGAVARHCLLMQAGDECPEIEFDLRKCGATFPLVLNVLADRLAKRCERDQGPVGGATKSAI